MWKGGGEQSSARTSPARPPSEPERTQGLRAPRVPVRWGRGLGSFGGLRNNVERLGVGEEQVKRKSTGDRGDCVCDPVRRGTKRARDAPGMSAGGTPPMTTWDGRGLRAADTRDFPAPNRTSELEPCALLQLQGHAVCVRAGPWTPAPPRHDQLGTACLGRSRHQPGPRNEGTRGGRGSSAPDGGPLALQSHPACARGPFGYCRDISAASTQPHLSPHQPAAHAGEGCVVPSRSPWLSGWPAAGAHGRVQGHPRRLSLLN